MRSAPDGWQHWRLGPLGIRFATTPELGSIIDMVVGRGAVPDSIYVESSETPTTHWIDIALAAGDHRGENLTSIAVTLEASARPGAYSFCHAIIDGHLVGFDATEEPMGADLCIYPPVGTRRIGGLAGALLAASRAICGAAAPLAGGLLIHGCAMVLPQSKDAALLFVGPSGAGKTTMSLRLPHWERLADETCMVWRDVEGVWRVGGTPFPGKERLERKGTPRRLAGIVQLHPREERLRLDGEGAADAFNYVLRSVVLPLSSGPIMVRATDLAQRLTEEIGVRSLYSSLDHSARELDRLSWQVRA